MSSVCLWQCSVRYLKPVEYAAPIEPSYEISKKKRLKTTEVKKSNKKMDSTQNKERKTSVPGPDSYVFGPPGFRSASQR